MTEAEQQRAYAAEVALARSAQAFLETNEAARAYLDQVETRAIDAMLACGPSEDLERLRLSVVANTIRQMKQFMREAVAAGDFAEQVLKAGNSQQGERNGA